MDYFNNVLIMFLDLEHFSYVAVYGRVRKLSDLIRNILISIPKMNEGLTRLEQHEGE